MCGTGFRRRRKYLLALHSFLLRFALRHSTDTITCRISFLFVKNISRVWYIVKLRLSLFTVGALPRNKLEFTVVLVDVVSTRNNGNASPNESDRIRLKWQESLNFCFWD